MCNPYKKFYFLPITYILIIKMGATTSHNETPRQYNGPYDAATIHQNIVNAFSNRPVKASSYLSEQDTLGWNNANITGGARRDRYNQYDPRTLLNELMQNSAQKGGNMGYGHETNNYLTGGLNILDRQIDNETGQSGGCGCDGGVGNLSATSSMPVDFSVLRGGAKSNTRDAENKNNKNKSRKSKNNDDDIDAEDENDDDIDADEDNDDDIDLDEEDLDDDLDEDEGMARATRALNGLSDIVKPFYSSDSDFLNIRRRN